MAELLNIGISGLKAFQHSLATTGHNISNSDTVGYSRQRTILATQVPQLTGAGYIGSGVKVVAIERQYDNFLATQMRSAQSAASELETYVDHASRIDNILSDPNIGLNPSMQDFFNSMQELADNPASIPTRQLLLAESQSMVDRFHDLNRQFTNARDELNKQLKSVSEEINGLSESLARVNRSIIEAIGAAGGGSPNDLMDEREVLLNELSKRVDISIVPQDDGAWNVFIGKGQALVIGGIAAKMTTALSTSDVTELDIAFTNAAGTQVITDQITGGEIGGLLTYRDQILDPGQNQLGLLAVGISDRLNAQNQLGLDLDGNFGGRIFNASVMAVIPNTDNTGGAAVSALFVDTGNLTASDYELKSTGVADQFILTRVTDGQTTTINTGGAYPHTTAEIDGFSLTISAAAAVGDRFLIRPTRDAAASLSLEITNARQFAAAGIVRSVATGNTSGSPNLGSGSISQPDVSSPPGALLGSDITLTFDAANSRFNVDLDGDSVTDTTLAFDPVPPSTDSNGVSYTLTVAGFGDMTFSASGTPLDGDQFVIENNTSGVGDNRNALVMAELQNQNTLLGQTGGAVETATFQETYAQLVSEVGAKTHTAEVNFESTDGLLERHKNSLLSVSGVNLDEEAANLIKYQQAYQAAAQTISVAKSLFDTLLAAVRN